jgi:hypothetical protein
MNFTRADIVEQVVWQMRLADYPRATNRALVNDLANGVPPYTQAEVAQNNIDTNVNFLELTRVAHDARRQFYNALSVPFPYFNVDVDIKPKHLQQEISAKVTQFINRIMKDSQAYHEVQRSTFASDVLHGIGPVNWEDQETWCPLDIGVEDVLVPSNTLLSMRNLPFVSVFRQYTPMELWLKTHGPNVDPGWNMDVVDAAIEWADRETQTLMGSSWPEVWSPEKMSERIKSDGGLYSSDAVPTIDCFDFYFWNDEGKKSGWRRRIILDAWGEPGVGGAGGVTTSKNMPDRKRFKNVENSFLYDGKTRRYANHLSEFIHFQFADASSVAPFRYHSVRSVGFLLYAVCHLQNRLRCRFNDHVFESLLQYFRISNPADMDRLTKVDLVNKGILPEGLNFVGQQERWKIDNQIVQENFQLNRQTMADNSASFTQDFDFGKENQEETATRTMAKVNSTAALVSAMLNQAYNYQTFQYREIARRFCMPGSKDPDVRKFRKLCLTNDIPVEALSVDRWNIEPNRVIGGGNKTLAVAMADKLMSIVNRLDPDSQKEVDRIFIGVNSDNWDLANRLVPETKVPSDSTILAQSVTGSLMDGFPVSVKPGINHVDYVEALLANMAFKVHMIDQQGGMTDQKTLMGLQNMGNHIQQHIQILSQDKNQKEIVKKLGDALGQIMNRVKAYGQRLQEAMQKAQAQNGQGAPQMDPKDQAKIQAIQATAAQKQKIAADSHAQRTAQRQLQFEQDMRQRRQEAQLEMAKTRHDTTLEMAQKQHDTALDIRANRMKSLSE